MCSRLGMTGLLAGKWLLMTLVGIVQVTVMFAWAQVAFGVDLLGHLPGFCVMTVVTAGAAASFALTLAALCRTRTQLNAIATIVILSMSALGGSMVPRYVMGETMQELGKVTFNAWALDGYIKVFWRSLPVRDLGRRSSVLVGVASSLFAAPACWPDAGRASESAARRLGRVLQWTDAGSLRRIAHGRTLCPRPVRLRLGPPDSRRQPRPAGTGQLEVTVTGFESDEGQVLVALFLDERGWPGDQTLAFGAIVLPIRGRAGRRPVRGRARGPLRGVGLPRRGPRPRRSTPGSSASRARTTASPATPAARSAPRASRPPASTWRPASRSRSPSRSTESTAMRSNADTCRAAGGRVEPPRPRGADPAPSPAGATGCSAPLTAVVAGGGLAGVAAATVLAERGVSVVLAEREPFLGGRAGAWTDRLSSGEPFEMERGFHAFFRQYYNLQSLLRRIDGDLSFLEPMEDYPILGPGGQVESFSGLPNTPPWNVIALDQAHPDPRPARSDAGQRPCRPRDAPLRARLDLRPLRRGDRRRVPRLAAVPAGRAPHALRRLRPLLLQSRGGDVGGRAADDVPLLLRREPGGADLRRLEAALLEVDLGAPGRRTCADSAWTCAPAARCRVVARGTGPTLERRPRRRGRRGRPGRPGAPRARAPVGRRRSPRTSTTPGFAARWRRWR